jgi:hypothetical protein
VYAHLDCLDGAYSVAEAKATRMISLPIRAEPTEQQQDRIVAAIREYADARMG